MTTMTAVAERITYLRKRDKVTQTMLAKSIRLSRTTIRNWEDGISDPNLESLIALADFFSVSIDFLVGIDDREMLSLDGLYKEEKEAMFLLKHQFQKSHGRARKETEGFIYQRRH